ncbi:MAG: hypothetical protein HRU18_06825 [Pseudoalteromonas sp.]|uniref:hypothetical protein n=1 Tax=Pseudoalteromonas sp. TaxID=53249 RepID=UPI001E024111|nr:hypothetical protein [Pseudoalteromonas sp.]NRA77904.1 hypothetical protein [Pseudoalteromonas sp.]
MVDIYGSIVAWYKEREPRKFDKTMSIIQMRTQYNAWLNAATPADGVKALGQLLFVSMGHIWKTDEEQAMVFVLKRCERFLNELDNEPNPAFFVAMILDSYEYGDQNDLHALTMIGKLAGTQMTRYGLSEEEVMGIMCISNHSKTVLHTATEVEYINPLPALQILLDKVGN